MIGEEISAIRVDQFLCLLRLSDFLLLLSEGMQLLASGRIVIDKKKSPDIRAISSDRGGDQKCEPIEKMKGNPTPHGPPATS